jgi:hypothetical protein
VITAAHLRTQTVRDLAAIAKREGIVGWHSMRKEQLIKAILKLAKEESSGRNGKRGSRNGTPKPIRAADGRFESPRKAMSPQNRAHLEQVRAKLAQAKDLAHKNTGDNRAITQDRIIMMVRDPYWLHAYWELTSTSIERAKVAMGQYWHMARPILRLSTIEEESSGGIVRTLLRDIEIHGGVNHWYIDVKDPPKSYQIDIGYLSGSNFHCLARSNVVNTAAAKKPALLDEHWRDVAQEADRIFAISGGYEVDEEYSQLRKIFEEKLRRPIGTPIKTIYGMGAETIGDERIDFHFEIDAEMVLYGACEPGSHVVLKEEPIRLKEDGTFVLRFPLPDRRQVFPLVAKSADGMEEQTIILAVERNTKVLDTVLQDQDA